jgi:hypothetical protein
MRESFNRRATFARPSLRSTSESVMLAWIWCRTSITLESEKSDCSFGVGSSHVKTNRGGAGDADAAGRYPSGPADDESSHYFANATAAANSRQNKITRSSILVPVRSTIPSQPRWNATDFAAYNRPGRKLDGEIRPA